jgi:hypothetical protein
MRSQFIAKSSVLNWERMAWVQVPARRLELQAAAAPRPSSDAKPGSGTVRAVGTRTDEAQLDTPVQDAS